MLPRDCTPARTAIYMYVWKVVEEPTEQVLVIDQVVDSPIGNQYRYVAMTTRVTYAHSIPS